MHKHLIKSSSRTNLIDVTHKCSTPWRCCSCRFSWDRTAHHPQFPARPSTRRIWSISTCRGPSVWSSCTSSPSRLANVLYPRLVGNLWSRGCCCRKGRRIWNRNRFGTPSTWLLKLKTDIDEILFNLFFRWFSELSISPVWTAKTSSTTAAIIRWALFIAFTHFLRFSVEACGIFKNKNEK